MQFYRMMYSGKSALISIMGKVYATIDIARGVRQGDHASMVRFCVGTAPLQLYINKK